jgi:probable HAF family extracellular repeat protein
MIGPSKYRAIAGCCDNPSGMPNGTDSFSRFRRRVVLLWLMLVALVAAAGLSGTEASRATVAPRLHWIVTDLGTLPGDDVSEAVAINNRGQIAGNSGFRGFIWENGRMTAIGSLGDHVTNVDGMNDRGQVIATETKVSPLGGKKCSDHGYVWQRGVMTDLGPCIFPTGINDRGQIVGYRYCYSCKQPAQAFLWQSGEITYLGTLGGASSDAESINDRGQIIGVADTELALSGQTCGSYGAGGGEDGFVWQNGVMTDLGPCTDAEVINDRGQVVVSNRRQGSNIGLREAKIWQDGSTSTLPWTRDDLYGRARAINNEGQIVGYCKTTGTGTTRPCRWDSKTVVDLGTLFGGGSGQAFDINEQGQIVGRVATDIDKTTAVVWQNGHITRLGTPHKGESSEAIAINDHNEIVGDSSGHAVLWKLTRK